MPTTTHQQQVSKKSQVLWEFNALQPSETAQNSPFHFRLPYPPRLGPTTPKSMNTPLIKCVFISPIDPTKMSIL